jgi:ABC-type multidrug transport system fused ATPase/permease subunit
MGPALIVANLAFQRRMRTLVEAAQQSRGDVATIAHESFDSALVIKTLGREAAEVDRFATTTEQLRDEMIEVGRLRAVFDPMIEALPNIGILLVFVVGAWRVQATDLTAGDLVGFAYLFRLSAIPLRVFGWLLGDIPRAVVGMERIDRVLDADVEEDDGSVQLPAGTGLDVAVTGLSYHHPVDDHLDARGLQDVDVAAMRGQTIAIVGPTAAGKSTLAWLVARLLEPQAGSVMIDGIDLQRVARNTIPDTVSIVFQESFIFDDTVANNITLGGDWTHGEIVAAAGIAQAHGFVNHLPDGYDTVVGERGTTLSGGQRQRIALARALVRRPRLLILDDATSACDPSVEAAILERLSGADLPATVLLIAYRSGSIGLADQVLFLDEGRAVAQGVHDELMVTVPGYRQLITAYERRAEERARQEGP